MAISAGSVILAADVGQFRQIQTGGTSISFTAQTANSTTITFPVAFAVAPNVATNITSGVAATSGWNCRAISVTPTGFVFFSFGSSATWASVGVSWIAVAN